MRLRRQCRASSRWSWSEHAAKLARPSLRTSAPLAKRSAEDPLSPQPRESKEDSGLLSPIGPSFKVMSTKLWATGPVLDDAPGSEITNERGIMILGSTLGNWRRPYLMKVRRLPRPGHCSSAQRCPLLAQSG